MTVSDTTVLEQCVEGNVPGETNGVAREQIKAVKELCQVRHRGLEERMRQMEEQVEEIRQHARRIEGSVGRLNTQFAKVLGGGLVLWFIIQVFLIPEIRNWLWR